MMPDESTFRAHLAGPRFQSGVDRGWWRLVSVDWPHALIAVAAAERAGGPAEFALRFELAGYPVVAPTAAPWDLFTGALLAQNKRPKGALRISTGCNGGELVPVGLAGVEQ
jgi:hypothetical protein